MADRRLADETFIRKLPRKQGKKAGKSGIKIELFRGTQFASRWFPGDDSFFPKPPLQSQERKEFWERMFRVRMDGKWLGVVGRVRLFSVQEVRAILLPMDNE
jgi:hypothetical protein